MLYEDEIEEINQLKERWMKRANRLTDVKSMKPAFDYSALERLEIPSFDRENYMDPAIDDLR